MATTTYDRPVILDEPTRPIHARQAFAAINGPSKWTMARIGAVDRMDDIRHVQLDMTCDGRRKLRLIVTLTPGDTYSVEVGKFGTLRTGMRWTSRAVRRGVHAEQLATAVEGMYEEVYA